MRNGLPSRHKIHKKSCNSNMNDTFDDHYHVTATSVAKAIPMILLTLAAFLENSLVLIAVAKSRSLRQLPGNVFIVNLALTDVMGATLCMPFGFVTVLLRGRFLFGDSLCQFQAFLIVTLSNVTFLTLLGYSPDVRHDIKDDGRGGTETAIVCRWKASVSTGPWRLGVVVVGEIPWGGGIPWRSGGGGGIPWRSGGEGGGGSLGEVVVVVGSLGEVVVVVGGIPWRSGGGGGDPLEKWWWGGGGDYLEKWWWWGGSLGEVVVVVGGIPWRSGGGGGDPLEKWWWGGGGGITWRSGGGGGNPLEKWWWWWGDPLEK
ncbi:hypothetical protein QZH41_004676 [Actinostola sp. cb2023]|nr:hypothetical protein QZH41_004676 [Actinostola sp. cb2023]